MLCHNSQHYAGLSQTLRVSKWQKLHKVAKPAKQDNSLLIYAQSKLKEKGCVKYFGMFISFKALCIN